MQEQLTAPHRIFPDTAIELILARQVASYLALPIILTDAQGDLVFYNEPAEAVLGLRFDSTGQIPLSERVAALFLRDEDGEAVPFDEVPVVQVLRTGRPVYRRMLMRGLDNVDRRIETTSFPLMRRDDTLVGALIVFWERPGSASG
jgi:PAS domain-containing protein